MKKLFALLSSVAMVATLLSGCTTEPEINEIPSVSKHIIKVVANADTRTYYDGNPQIKWSSDDVLTLIEVDANKNKARYDSTGIDIDADGKATFTFELTTNTAAPFTYRAIMITKNHEDDNLDGYFLPNLQDATVGTFDPRADILVAKPLVGLSSQPDTDEGISMEFARCVAINKMKLTGLLDDSADIRSVSFHTPETGTVLAGALSITYDNENDDTATISFSDDDSAYCNKGVTVFYGATELAVNGEFDVYFTTMPATLTQGFIVDVYTTRYHYHREVSLAGKKPLDLQCGNLNSFKVSLSESKGTTITPLNYEVYTLVTDVADLEGSEIVITNSDVTKVMTNEDSSNKKGSTNVADVDTENNTISIDEQAMVLTVIKNDNNTYSFLNSSDEYLSGGNSTNLKTTNTPGGSNTQWTIAINSITNIATIHPTAATSSTNRCIVFKSDNNIFGNYADQTPANVKIYKKITTANTNVPQIRLTTSDIPTLVPVEGATYHVPYELVGNITDANIEVRDYNGCVSGVGNLAPTINTTNKTIDFTVDANGTGEVRHGSLMIGGKYGTVYHTITALIEFDQAATAPLLQNCTLTLDYGDLGEANSSYTGFNGSHSKSDSNSHSIEYTTTDVCNYSNRFQFKKSSGCLKNSTNLGKITSITISGVENTFTVYGGATAENVTNEATVNNGVYTFAGDYGFFSINAGSNATYCTQIVVAYAHEGTGGNTPTATPLTTPQNVMADLVTGVNNAIEVVWDYDSDAASYTISWTDGENANSYTKTVSGSGDCNYTISDLEYETHYTVSVVANPASDDSAHTSSAAAVCDPVTTGEDPNGGSQGGGNTVVLSEDFSEFSHLNNDSNSAWKGNTNFPTISTVYGGANGTLKFGTGSKTGSITSKSLDLSKAFTVELDIKGWTTVEGQIKITVGSQSKTITYTETSSDDFGHYSVDFNAATTSSTVKIETTAKRAYIDNVVVTRHD